MDAALNLLEAVLGSPWLFLLIFAATAIDVVFPIVPAETLLITAGVYALTGTPDPLLLIVSASIGAIIGDFAAHLLGRGTGRFSRWARRSKKGEALFAWAQRIFARRGASALIAGRFVPGGRSATTIASGMLRYPRRRVLLFSSIGAVTWASYSTGIGMLGGLVLRDNPLLGAVLGIALALAITGIIEAVRYVMSRRAIDTSLGRSHPLEKGCPS